VNGGGTRQWMLGAGGVAGLADHTGQGYTRAELVTRWTMGNRRFAHRPYESVVTIMCDLVHAPTTELRIFAAGTQARRHHPGPSSSGALGGDQDAAWMNADLHLPVLLPAVNTRGKCGRVGASRNARQRERFDNIDTNPRTDRAVHHARMDELGSLKHSAIPNARKRSAIFVHHHRHRPQSISD
jgi:hypothetical protein